MSSNDSSPLAPIASRTRSASALYGTSIRTGVHSVRMTRVFGGSSEMNVAVSAVFPMPSSPTTARVVTMPCVRTAIGLLPVLERLTLLGGALGVPLIAV